MDDDRRRARGRRLADRRHPQHGAHRRRGGRTIAPRTIWTVGHSTRPIDAFLDLLAHHGIQAVADVRRFPASRRHPQFGREALQQSLEDRGLAYRWIPRLGGRRTPRPDSKNTAWRNLSFRGYADYTETDEFGAGLDELLELAAARPTAMMCAEQLWWHCHRALIADVLRARAIDVLHIVDGDKAQPHRPLLE